MMYSNATFRPSFVETGSSFPMSLRFLLCQDHKEQDIMRVHFKAMESYGEGNSASQALVADKVIKPILEYLQCVLNIFEPKRMRSKHETIPLQCHLQNLQINQKLHFQL